MKDNSILQKIKIQNKEFLEISVSLVQQKEKIFYIGIIPAEFFLEVYTVEPTEYDIEEQKLLAQSFPDDRSYYESRIEKMHSAIDTQPFQRREQKTRVNQISEFLNKEEYPLFPNTIITSCKLYADSSKLEELSEDKKQVEEIYESSLSFLQERDQGIYLYIPYKKNSLLVIDGQHRVKGLQEAGNEVINNYNLLVSFIVGYDRSAVANLFYTINYTQKSVNKSLLYHLMGEFSKDLDEITFMHETVKLLNELEKSPFYEKIKMLGHVPKDLPREKKEKMTLSQAFLVDYLSPTISIQSKNSIHQPVFLYYFKKEKEQIEIIRFIIKFFSAIRSLKPKDWNSPKDNILCKSVCIGAFIKMMHFFFVKLFIDECEKKPEKIKDITEDELKDKLKGVEKLNFSKEGPFGSTGGAGGLNDIKKNMIKEIDYFETDNYEIFLSSYKSNYMNPFKEWLAKNVTE